ncbi:hypothetical protein [Sphingomonas sp. URHD0057]|uniref:hypothetical protein n=1 Tax=Sphingomonas sp. URHD0057 TaxID=1380389 RepID=UPI001E42B536|nr:hypothetical protein [Sphingomonas sp. URHD0057]
MFDYVMVLASVIIGLGVTHLLTGVASIIQHPDRGKIYWIHLLWVAATFLRAIFWWWFEFAYSGATWTFGLYFFVLCYALLIYLWCALLFPRDLAGYDGYRDYFYSRRTWFFGVGLAADLADVADTLAKGLGHFLALGPIYLIGQAVLISFFIIALRTRNERFHACFAIFAVAWLLIYPLTNFDTVQQTAIGVAHQ